LNGPWFGFRSRAGRKHPLLVPIIIQPPFCCQRALRRTSARFLRYYHFQKPSRSLTIADHGTRFPG
jgi:hypothetical protein